MIKTDTLILGGGLAGLAAAYTLEGKKQCIIAEKAIRAGGLAATIYKNGYSFDYSGHLLHLRWKDTSELILKLLDGNYKKLNRNAKVFIAKRAIPFPFQANLKYVPEKMRTECIREFLKALKQKQVPPNKPEFYTQWAHRVFGKGISKYFMLPYNYKLLQHSLDLVTTEWCAPFVPIPNRDEILRGAYGGKNKQFGYNTEFIYPAKGGIGSLAEALASKISSLKLGTELIKLNLKTNTAIIRGLGEIQFKNLINTIPLNSFIKTITNAPDCIKKAAEKLKSNTVYVLNLGVKKPVSKAHWFYFPENKFPFYRAGIASNFSSYAAPRGHASIYLEFATDGNAIDFESAENISINALINCGIIKSKKQVEEKMWLKMTPAYVIYNRDRAEALPLIFDWLKKQNIQTIGRYGAWKYSFMEEAIKEGIEAANNVLLK